jgi:hypothetical protein
MIDGIKERTMDIMTAATGRTNLEQLVIELENALEKVDSMCSRAGARANFPADSAPWPADDCPWGHQLVDGALAAASLTAALTIFREGLAAQERRRKEEAAR